MPHRLGDWTDYEDLPPHLHTFDDLRARYPCWFLEAHGRFVRVTTDPGGSAWYCSVCGGLNVEPGEDRCHSCDED